jgi:hypothetical protein
LRAWRARPAVDLGAPAGAGRRARRRLRPSLALGRRTVRAARYPIAELHCRPAGQRQDPAGPTLGRSLASRRLPWPGAVGGWRRSGSGAAGCGPGPQVAGRSIVGCRRRSDPPQKRRSKISLSATVGIRKLRNLSGAPARESLRAPHVSCCWPRVRHRTKSRANGRYVTDWNAG